MATQKKQTTNKLELELKLKFELELNPRQRQRQRQRQKRSAFISSHKGWNLAESNYNQERK